MQHLLHQLLIAAAERWPDREAVIDRDRRLTYRQLDDASDRLAQALRAYGVGRGDRVGIWLPKSLEAVTAIFGALKAGAAYVPLDSGAPVKRTALLIRDCEVKALITGRKRSAQLDAVLTPPSGVECLISTDSFAPFTGGLSGAAATTWQEIQARPAALFGADAQTGEDLAYVLYTSGSTGEPKGVMISHRAALAFVNWACACFQVGPQDRVASHAPFHFDLSIFDLFATVQGGAAIVLVPEALSVFPRELADFIDAQRISVWYSVPSVLTRLVLHGDLDRLRFANLTRILFAGEVFPVKYLRQLITRISHARYYNLYGPTGTNVCTFHAIPAEGLTGDEPLLIGKACAGAEAFAVTEEGRLAMVGEVGELYVRGPSLMSGYWGRPEESRRALSPPLSLARGDEDRVYRTGDLVKENAEGDYLFLGRRDSQIKSRGYRIELGEIEAVLASHPLVEEVAVVADPDEEIGRTLRAVAATRGGVEPPAGELEAFCAERLPRYMVPGRIEFRRTLPRTSTGKIDRRALEGNPPGDD